MQTFAEPASPWHVAGRRLWLNEVGPRDGFQVEPVFVPTADKIALIDALSALGFAKIEATAFVSPKAVPALADAAEVMRGIRRAPGVVYAALVPNARGAEAAIAAGADELNLVMSASETHNLANLRMTREQSFAQFGAVVALARAAGRAVNVSLSCSFGCPMEGEVAAAEVLGWVERFTGELGVTRVALCDTTGMAFPPQVEALVGAVLTRWPGLELTLHFHDTRGLGLANLLAAAGAGATRFDMALGGLGGCPYAPGATGNVCSEDVVHALALMGYDTGIDLEGLIAASRRLPALIGRETPGQVAKAGRRLDLHAPPAGPEAVRARRP
ncbi:hydroxymethylglutaryl-CoA lyase [Derxia gummosa]|uniref:Hydroxymethylglutaryl-CoA lyase n=1 Tax=Derxia gummosa DSM 723 TaxID=1121388 RepID=A0A9U5GPP0_9BURK|nr:hydroxymethylglutaryl-CoA lyase [Derxia gummosa]